MWVLLACGTACREWNRTDEGRRGPTDWNLFAQHLINRIAEKVPQYKVGGGVMPHYDDAA